MSKKQPAPPANPAADEHAGMGGQYEFDEATQTRRLVSRTAPAVPRSQQPPADAAAPTDQPAPEA